jgi:hypothetical protein
MATPAELLQMTDEELKAYIPTKYMRAGQPGKKVSVLHQALKNLEQDCKHVNLQTGRKRLWHAAY